MCETPQQPCNFPTSPHNLLAPSFESLPHMASQKFSTTILLLTVLALAFTKVNLLLLCDINFTSSTPFSWLFFGHETGIQVLFITPVFFIVVSSVFQCLSFLDKFSPIPPTSNKFHHHLNAWIHSMPVTVEKLQFSFVLISCCPEILNYSWLFQYLS